MNKFIVNRKKKKKKKRHPCLSSGAGLGVSHILTSYPIIAILHKLDSSGQLLKWVVELSELDIAYCPRFTVKGQVLFDFIAKMSDVHPHDISEPLRILETDG